MRIFTDASGSGGVVGISYVITDIHHNILGMKAKTIFGVDNNTAELEAIRFALQNMPKRNEFITIVSDSIYALNCVEGNHCRDFEQDTLDEIQEMLTDKKWKPFWIKGHTHDGTALSEFNSLADSMAKRVREDYLDKRRKKVKRVSKQKRKGKER
jgi:ribonuclease HI